MRLSVGLVVLGCAAAMSAAACSASSDRNGSDPTNPGAGGTSNGKMDNPDLKVSTHRSEVERCTAEKEKTMETALATLDMVQALYDYEGCLATADDDALTPIETNLSDIDAATKGTTKATFGAWRQLSVCTTLVEASEGAEGSIGKVYLADCSSAHELMLANAIDAYVSFGVDVVSIAEDRKNHAPCYAEFDKASDQASNQNEMAQAAFALTDCVEADLQAKKASIVDAILGNYPSRAKADVQKTVDTAIAKELEQASALCDIMADASDSGGGSLATLYNASCRTDFANALYSTIQGFVP